MEKSGCRVRVCGIVQGVGFRPFVYALAQKYHAVGWVKNTSSGVEIEINAQASDVEGFLRELRTSPPPLARIDEFTAEPCPVNSYTGFEILESQPEEGRYIPISPDITICPDCLREMQNPADRRYRYPFINCTNCGPRFSIIQDIPYDRPKTTMAPFEMCPSCAGEYHNPADRRFHAQPTACPDCGPHVWFQAGDEILAAREEAIQMARRWLQEGKILAIKGLGGYHLACDAANREAVIRLRERKKRSDKPFALMAYDLQAVRSFCRVSPEEEKLLLSPQHPIVLLEMRPDSFIAPEAAPNQRTLGVMLPYTPLHILLLEPAAGYPRALVMTSGNLSEEPIAYQDDDAGSRLTPLADAFLLHNRDIHMRVDDSVARIVRSQPYLIRRSRGYAPDPIHLPFAMEQVLAVGAELKNTFCLTRDAYAFVSHYIGDLENYETLRSFEEGIDHFRNLFRIHPRAIACDLHPDYLSSRYAGQAAETENLPLVQVQHHHAHLAACLADNRWQSAEQVIGLSYDGTGLGTDHAIWGGEVLYGGYAQVERIFHLAYAPLPGGDAATRNPSRVALAQLWQAGLDWDPDLPPVQALCPAERSLLRAQLDHAINSPLTSSLGRLFDAAAALMGIRQTATYEGQAAIEMEQLCDPLEQGAYPLALQSGEISTAALWPALTADVLNRCPQPLMAARFHNALVRINLEACRSIRSQTGCSVVALSGGVWQNRILLEKTITLLENDGFQVLIHRQVPTNDGGIALGQAAILGWSLLHGMERK